MKERQPIHSDKRTRLLLRDIAFALLGLVSIGAVLCVVFVTGALITRWEMPETGTINRAYVALIHYLSVWVAGAFIWVAGFGVTMFGIPKLISMSRGIGELLCLSVNRGKSRD